MVESLKEVFGNSVDGYFWLIILISGIMFSKIELDQNNIKIKMALIYILFFVLAFFNIFDIKILIPLFLIITFVFQEFIFIDDFKRCILKKISYLILDYFYHIVFEYKVIYFFISIFFVSNFFNNVFINNLTIVNTIFSGIAVIILFNGIVKCFNNEFKTLNFDEIYNKMQKIMFFSKFGCNDKLYDFSNILISKEDRSYFIRSNSYNWLSIEFFVYRLKRMYKKSSENRLSKIRVIGKVINLLFFVYNIFKEIINLALRIFKKIFVIFFKVILGRNSIKYYMRGYSTIEMQLIRTLAVIHGYSNHVIQRKFYEMIYSKIFFSSLKSFYAYHQYGNMSQYKYYLIYLYIRVAPVRINKKNYSSILKLYNKKKVNEITIEEFYIWTLGLSHHIIDKTLINNKIVEEYNMNRNKLKKLIKNYSTD